MLHGGGGVRTTIEEELGDTLLSSKAHVSN